LAIAIHGARNLTASANEAGKAGASEKYGKFKIIKKNKSINFPLK
jgi:hypothetical protein